MNVYNTDLSLNNRDFGEQRKQMLEPNTCNNMKVSTYLRHHRNFGEQARHKMLEPNSNSDMKVMNTSTTNNNNSPSNINHLMYDNYQSSLPLVSSSVDFQQHLHQLQQQQQIKYELHQLQKRKQELVQMMSTNTTQIMSTNTTTMQNKYSPYKPMSMSQNQHQQQQHQQLQLSTSTATTATSTATITPPSPKKKPVSFGNGKNFIIDLTEDEVEPATFDNTTNTVLPGELDICIGGGTGVYNHKGNIYYRKVVESFRKKYEAIPHKSDKTKFIRGVVVAFIYDNGCQFVKKEKDPNSSSYCTWVPVDHDVAGDKVYNSFRNAK